MHVTDAQRKQSAESKHATWPSWWGASESAGGAGNMESKTRGVWRAAFARHRKLSRESKTAIWPS